MVFKTTALLYGIVNSILYKLKIGMQMHLLPGAGLFSKRVLSYKTIFCHSRNWCKQNVYKSCWMQQLTNYKNCLNSSSGDLVRSQSDKG